MLLGSDVSEKISFGSEAGLFSDQVKIPCVVCGPGSISQAHRPDEYIETDQLSQCWHFISNIISHLQRSPLPTD
jgi:acetylornithine deacetylase